MSMQKQAVVIKPYDRGLPQLFRREKRRLKKLLPGAGIYHVGSSAVPGLGGKNVIDILVVMPSMRSALGGIAKIEAAGYELRLGAGGPERIFFSRGPQARHFHLHLAWRGTSERKAKLFFRDYLRKHPLAAAEYYRVKVRAARKAGPDRRKYLGLKSAFIDRVMRKA